MPGPVTLQVDLTPGVLVYRLYGDDGPMLSRFEQPIEEGTLEREAERVHQLLRRPEAAGLHEEAVAVGGRLYRTFVPAGLQHWLEKTDGSVVVSTSLPDFHFELFHDGREFIGLRLAIGRIVDTTRTVEDVAKPARDRLQAVVIGADPDRDLAFVEAETEAVAGRLEACGQMLSIHRRLDPSAEDVSALLAKGTDVLHFCGHVDRRDGTVGLRLGDGGMFSAAEITRSVADARLVFLNGCSSARASNGFADGATDVLASVAGAFMVRGTRGVVATVSDVSDAHAATLATAFYQHVLGGVPLGESLRRARVRCHEVAPDSPTFLSFVLYGGPAQTLRNGVSPPAPAPRLWYWLIALAAVAIAAVVVARGWLPTWTETDLRARILLAYAVYGEKDPKLEDLVRELQDYYMQHGRSAEAIAPAREVLRLAEVRKGRGSYHAAVAKLNVAYVLGEVDRCVEAMPLYDRAIRRIKAGQPAGLESNVPNALDNRSICLTHLGRLDEAERDQRRALKRLARLPQEPRVLEVTTNVQNNAAIVLRRRGRLEEAAALYLEILARPGKEGDVTTLRNLAILRWEQGRLDDAAKGFREVRDRLERVAAPGDERIAKASCELAWIDRCVGNIREADSLPCAHPMRDDCIAPRRKVR